MGFGCTQTLGQEAGWLAGCLPFPIAENRRFSLCPSDPLSLPLSHFSSRHNSSVTSIDLITAPQQQALVSELPSEHPSLSSCLSSTTYLHLANRAAQSHHWRDKDQSLENRHIDSMAFLPHIYPGLWGKSPAIERRDLTEATHTLTTLPLDHFYHSRSPFSLLSPPILY